MRSLRLLFPIYFRRLRWEIAGWWLLSGSLSILFHNGHAVERLQGWSLAEVIIALWLTMRLALIDDVFGTLTGRQWRPVRTREILAARLTLVLLAFLPPLLLRSLAWQRWAMPDAGMWRSHLLESVAPSLGFLLATGLGIQLASTLNRWAFKRGRKTAAVVMAVLAGWCLLRVAGHYHWRNREYSGYDRYASSAVFNAEAALRGVRSLLPRDAILLGTWRTYGYPTSYPAMREMMRLPLREGRIPVEPGVEAIIAKPVLSGWDLSFEIRLRCRDQETARKFVENTSQVVRFRDGYYSDVSGGSGSIMSSSIRLLPLRDVVLKGGAVAPSVMPWRDAGKGTGIENAELIFYTWDKQSPSIPIAPDPCIRFVRREVPQESTQPEIFRRMEAESEDRLPPISTLAQLPAISRKTGSWTERGSSFDTYAVVPDEPGTSAADRIRGALTLVSNYGDKDPRILESVMGLGREAIPPLLALPTWSDAAWEQIVRPVLLAHVNADHRGILLERLQTETRLSAIFLAKGWAGDALPVLRAKVADGLPLELDSLKILAATKEKGWAADLKRSTLHSSGGSEELDALLKDYPGFDWQGYAMESWQQRRHRWLPFDQNPWPAIRAAREGDVSAFRYVAERAVQQEQGYEQELPRLVAGEPQDAVMRVKENFAAFKFDAATAKWAMP